MRVIRKTCFLFGAGAETGNNYGLPTGPEFMRRSFLDESIKETLVDALHEIFSGQSYFDGSYDYQKSTFLTLSIFRSILKKWIYKECIDIDYFEKYELEIRSIMTNDDLEELFKAIMPNAKDIKELVKGNPDIETNDGNSMVERFRAIFSNDKTLDISQVEQEVKDTLLGAFIDKIKDSRVYFKNDLPTGIAHILDSHFHTIIDPKKYGPVKFSRVFNYYWAIFFAVYRPIVEFKKDNKPFDYSNELRSLSARIRALYKESDEIDKNGIKTYYRSISEIFESEDIAGVITSNYFNFVELITDNVAYLNGQLRLFEIPEELTVIDILKEPLPQGKLFFPFVMGQSYTKPIVSTYQIQAFHKMQMILDDSSDLVVLGYNVNEDDNHINAYLRAFLLTDKEPTVWVPKGKMVDLRHCLRLSECDGDIREYEMDYEKNSPETIVRELHQMIASS